MEGNKQMDIAFDIETMPNSSRLDAMPEPEVKTGNLKDPAKIAEKVAEARAEQVAKMALNPLYGRICAAVFIARNRAGEFESLRLSAADSDDEERELIEKCFAVLGNPELRLITWNGIGFDLPFLYRRAVLTGADITGAPPLTSWTKRYSTGPHIDLMQIWGGWNSTQFARLDDVGRAVVNEHKIEIDLREFPELVKTEAGREKILDYCEQDVRLTYQIFDRFKGILF